MSLSNSAPEKIPGDMFLRFEMDNNAIKTKILKSEVEFQVGYCTAMILTMVLARLHDVFSGKT